MSLTLTDDEVFLLGLALDDWLANTQPEDDDSSRDRYMRVSQLRDRIGEIEPDEPAQPPNPAACPECKSIANVQAQGWIFARYSLDIDADGTLSFPYGATMEWDMCKPFKDLPEGMDPNAEYLSCTGCGIDYWYLPPQDEAISATPVKISPGRILGRA